MKYLLFLPLLWCGNVFAQPTISLACDIYPGPYSSEPKWITYHEGALYFFAKDTFDPNYNFGDVYSFFKFDGACSIPVDINETGSDLGVEPAQIASLGGKLYFSAYDGGTLGDELYAYYNNDVTLVADIYSGPYPSRIWDMTAINGKLYFSASDTLFPFSNRELWMHDPVANTTELIADINPNGSSSPFWFIPYNGKVYFAAHLPATGIELWYYDPSLGTTTMVSDINPGAGHGIASAPVIVNNKMYFAAKEPVYGKELYVYDGIGAPQRLTDINPNGDGLFAEIWSHNNMLYFGGDDGVNNTQLYKYDLSTNTASLAATIEAGINTRPQDFALYGNKIYFTAYTPAYGFEMWAYDGNTAAIVSDYIPDSAGLIPYGKIVYNNRLYFTGWTPATGWELHVLNDPTVNIQNTSPKEAAINIYPNPAYDNATISFTHYNNSDVTITLTNILGQQLYSTTKKSMANVEHKYTIPIDNFAPGLYYCTLRYNDGQSVHNSILTKQ